MEGKLVFKRGRYKNKTYEEVAKSDKTFCQAVLNSDRFNDFYPEEFKNYLISTKEPCVIKERTPKHFLKACSKEMISEIQNIIGNPKRSYKKVHDASSTHPNGFLGVFFRFCAKKHVLNLKKEKGYCKLIEDHSSIFPFRIYKNLPPRKVSVRSRFDEEFMKEIATFLSLHFEEMNYIEIIDLFLTNIFQFRKENFREDHQRSLKNLVENLNKVSFGSDGDRYGAFNRSTYINAYLKNFPRVSNLGVKRYQHLYKIYDMCMTNYRETELMKKEKNYFLHLPEINCYELFSLLDEDIFFHERLWYTKLFQKYIFFFWNALKSEMNPVFFIDDMLFECLKSYKTYKNSQADITDLKFVLSHIAMVYRRKQPLETVIAESCNIDENDLKNIKHYFENFPKLETVTVEYGECSDLLEIGTFMCSEDSIIDFRFSKHEFSHVDENILKAALSKRDIKKIVAYNAKTGTETIVEMPPIKNEIRNFVKKNSNYDLSEDLPPEKFLTWGLEESFLPNTIDWETKYKSP